MIREEAGPRVRLLASHADADVAVLQLADDVLIEPVFASGEDRSRWRVDVCRSRRVALFVPQQGRSALAGYEDAFAAAGTKLALPTPPATLAVLHDKARFTRLATDADIPVARTIPVETVEQFDEACALLLTEGLPLCVKPPWGVFGAGFWQLDNSIEAMAAMMDPDARVLPLCVMRAAMAEAPRPLLVMEFLGGVEWSIDCLCDNGRLIVGVARRKLGRAQRLEVDGPVFDIARAAIATFGLSGLINVQCRAAGPDDSDPRLLEINARMSGGCLYTRFAGINLPWWHVALALGLDVEANMPQPVGGALVAPMNAAMRVDGRRARDA